MPRRTPMVTEALQDYLQLRALHCAASTVSNDRSVLFLFASWCGPMQVGSITARRMTMYFVAEVTTRNPAASSYNKVLQRVRGFMDFCMTRGWIWTNLLADLKPKPVHRRERLRLSADELIRPWITPTTPETGLCSRPR